MGLHLQGFRHCMYAPWDRARQALQLGPEATEKTVRDVLMTADKELCSKFALALGTSLRSATLGPLDFMIVPAATLCMERTLNCAVTGIKRHWWSTRDAQTLRSIEEGKERKSKSTKMVLEAIAVLSA